MKISGKKLTFCIILFIFMICIIPVQAFSSDRLAVDLLDNGDAYITFDYSLNMLEKAAVYLKIADPNNELKKALEEMFHHPVTVDKVTNSMSRFRVEAFSSITGTNGTVVMKTPEISFTMAEEALKKYWFAPLVQADYTADIAIITYPDGYVEEFYDTDKIPATSRTLVS
ncbi:MAG: hypothetical protein GX268_02845 [Methanomicrobiales archaeon]|jgi:hypothetical protein|nr:hypothetical protein [Methanomicrobiales archaeon]